MTTGINSLLSVIDTVSPGSSYLPPVCKYLNICIYLHVIYNSLVYVVWVFYRRSFSLHTLPFFLLCPGSQFLLLSLSCFEDIYIYISIYIYPMFLLIIEDQVSTIESPERHK